MQSYSEQEQSILEKIRILPSDKVAEVIDFIDFLRLRDEDGRLTQATSRLSESAFRKVWENPEDADYDRL